MSPANLWDLTEAQWDGVRGDYAARERAEQAAREAVSDGT